MNARTRRGADSGLRRALCGVLATLAVMTASGCWSRHEIEEMALVGATGFDLAPDGESLDVTVVIVRPEKIIGAMAGGGGGGRGGGTDASWVVGARGRTATEALRALGSRSSRRLFFGQATILVVGEELARKGFAKILDAYERNPELRLRDYVVVARGTAREILSAQPNLEATQAAELTGICRNWRSASLAYPERVYVLARDMAHTFSEAATATVEVVEFGGKRLVEMRGMAAFRMDKVVGFLNGKEARGYMWITGKAPMGVAVVNCPADPRFSVSLEIVRSRSRLAPKLAAEGRMEIHVAISVEANLEQQEGRANIVTAPMLRKLERELESLVHSEVRAALSKARDQLGTDIFGFGQAAYHKYPSRLPDRKRWLDLFPGIPVVVSIKARVVRTGSIQAPVGYVREERR